MRSRLGRYLWPTLPLLLVVLLGLYWITRDRRPASRPPEVRAPESQPPAGTFAAKVIGVTDGDTLTVRAGETSTRIRLYGIDCPERGQEFGRRAGQFTRELTLGQVVYVRARDTDRYGRTVADVMLTDGRVVNHELVRNGLAWWYQHYAPDDADLGRLERDARDARLGLWGQGQPVPPWDWRRQRAAAGSSPRPTENAPAESTIPASVAP